MKNDPTTHQIKPQELHDGDFGEQQPLVIDVRSIDEYASGHVQGAVHIPLGELADRLVELPHDQLVVTYCNMSHQGESQGERAAALLREQGYQARVLTGGYPNWKNLLFPIEEARKVEQAQKEESNADADEAQGNKDAAHLRPLGSFWEVLLVFTRLGLTSFGGPIAHLGYFREEIVVRRKWLDEQNYADLLALCQFLPGPSSSQMGIALGMTRAGIFGGLAAWLGFTLPSAIALTMFASVTAGGQGITEAGWLRGLLIVAVAVVAQAVWGMARTQCPDRPRATIAILSAIAILLWPVVIGQILILAVGGLLGWRFLQRAEVSKPAVLPLHVPRRLAVACWIVFFTLLFGLPFLRFFVHNQALALFDTFFRVGSLVFGGGHVVLPLLQREVVPAGWVSNDQFLTGYAAAQAVPGPLFTFSAYLGTVSKSAPNGWLGALIALAAIFLPSFFFVAGILPFWNRLRTIEAFQAALRGINAAVVGILLAALYQPIWTSAIHAPVDFALSLIAFGLLVLWKVPPWVVVVLSALLGASMSLL